MFAVNVDAVYNLFLDLSLFYKMFLYKDFWLRRLHWESLGPLVNCRLHFFGVGVGRVRSVCLLARPATEKRLPDWKTWWAVGQSVILHNIYWSLHTCAERPLKTSIMYLLLCLLFTQCHPGLIRLNDQWVWRSKPIHIPFSAGRAWPKPHWGPSIWDPVHQQAP